MNEADLRVNCYNFSATAPNHQDSFQPLCQHLQELHVWISRSNDSQDEGWCMYNGDMKCE